MIMEGVKVKVVSSHITPAKGSVGLRTQVPGAMATVSNLASATGGPSRAGIQGQGSLVERDNK